MQKAAALVVPGNLDSRTGGYIYDRHVVDGLRARDVYVRDRSSGHGCRGCVRVTTGVLAHTRQCVSAIEEVLCGAR